MYNQIAWKSGNFGKGFHCEKCNCHGHATSCRYDAEVEEQNLSMDVRGKYKGGGVCLNCTVSIFVNFLLCYYLTVFFTIYYSFPLFYTIYYYFPVLLQFSSFFCLLAFSGILNYFLVLFTIYYYFLVFFTIF